MFLIDENVSELEVSRLRRAGIRVRLIGDEVSQVGTSDEDLIRSIRKLKRPVVFTQDEDFFQFRWLHRGFALVWLAVNPDQVADYVRRFLRHPTFKTQAKRMGVVAKVAPACIRFWRIGNRQLQRVDWISIHK